MIQRAVAARCCWCRPSSRVLAVAAASRPQQDPFIGRPRDPRCTSSAMPASGAAMPDRADAVLSYWFGSDYRTHQPHHWPSDKAALWFRGGPQIDEEIKQLFGDDLKAIAAGQYDEWQQTPHSALAGIVLMDQFSRNVHRGTAQAFALDPKALSWALQLLDTKAFKELLLPYQQGFVLLALEHSEDLANQERCVALARENELAASQQQPPEDWAPLASQLGMFRKFAEAHEAVVRQWGRFPHRNALLGRDSTPAEEQGLKDGSIPAW